MIPLAKYLILLPESPSRVFLKHHDMIDRDTICLKIRIRLRQKSDYTIPFEESHKGQ